MANSNRVATRRVQHVAQMAFSAFSLILQHVSRFHVIAVLASIFMCAGIAHAAGANYVYDELGRLVQVIAGDGSSTQYAYDAAGNITAVKADTVNTLAISSFTPTSGGAGTDVTVFGSGFSPTAASNTVTINNVAATVTSASASQLKLTVPASATTGLITVSNANGSVTSTQAFTVGSTLSAPTITSFTPTIGAAGTAVTINGTNFQAGVSNNKAFFGGVGGVVTSLTAPGQAIATVPSSAQSGKVSLQTAAGIGTSSADFFVVPSGIAVTDVGSTGRIVVDGAAQTANVAIAGKTALIVFDGVIGQNLGLGFSPLIFNPNGGAATLYVKMPNGSNLISPQNLTPDSSFALPPLPVTGTYMIVIVPSASTQFNATLTLSSDIVGSLDVHSPTPITFANTRQGQNGRYAVSMLAGQTLGVSVTGSTFTSAYIALVDPLGTTITSVVISGASGSTAQISASLPGNYQVVVSPFGSGTGSLNLRAGMAPDLAISGLTAGAPIANSDGSFTIPVTYTVTNIGAVSAQSGWYDMGYLSADATLDNADFSNSYLGYHSALAPGESYTVTASFATSTTVARGNYTLFVKTDGLNPSYGGTNTDNGRLDETDETNNVASVAVLLSKPDLAISGLTAGAPIANSDGSFTIPVTYTVTNTGIIPVWPGWYDMAYLSTDAVLDNADFSNSYLGYHSALAQGASYTVTASFTTSTTVARGNYTLFVKTDGLNPSYGGTNTDNGRLDETDETNNVASVTVSLSKPDLAISGLTAGVPIANSDGSFTIPVTYTVTNTGIIPVWPGWYDMAYLSTDATLDNADFSNSYLGYHSALDVGKSYTVTANFTTSTTVARGSYTLFVKTDGLNPSYGGTNTDNGRLDETDETNNVISTAVTLDTSTP